MHEEVRQQFREQRQQTIRQRRQQLDERRRERERAVEKKRAEENEKLAEKMLVEAAASAESAPIIPLTDADLELICRLRWTLKGLNERREVYKALSSLLFNLSKFKVTRV